MRMVTYPSSASSGMVILNGDVVSEILEHLWVLHSTSWDSEFRPEAWRRFYSNYSLISKLWTLSAQRYIYRNAYLRYGTDWSSFQEGIKNPERGSFLRESVRIMDVCISHSSMGLSVQKLDKILSCCPNLVELRLSTGPEINTLFLKAPQQARLRSSLSAIRPTLRALQLRIDGRCKKGQVLKQIGELIPFSTLDFLSISSNDTQIVLPELDPAEWDTRQAGWSSIQWPLETNAHTTPLRNVLARNQDEEDVLPPVYPHTLRFNSTELYPWYRTHPFLQLLGSRLKHVMFQTMFDQAKWNKDCEVVKSSCPELEQMIITDCFWSQGRTNPAPRLYVLEPEDWPQVDSEADAEVAIVETASHVVCFVENFTKKWMKLKNPLTFRKAPVFDSRWLQEALTGQAETRSADDMKHVYSMSWSDTLIERNAQYMVALRRPSTLDTSEADQW